MIHHHLVFIERLTVDLRFFHPVFRIIFYEKMEPNRAGNPVKIYIRQSARNQNNSNGRIETETKSHCKNESQKEKGPNRQDVTHEDSPVVKTRFGIKPLIAVRAIIRSEEHTSELQSRDHLVCRLLLE